MLGFATVTANDYVNLRQEPSLSAKKLGTAPTGAVLTVFSLSGDWAYAQYMSITAYVHRNFLSALTTVYPGQSTSGGSGTAIGDDPGRHGDRQSASHGLHRRRSPSPSFPQEAG